MSMIENQIKSLKTLIEAMRLDKELGRVKCDSSFVENRVKIINDAIDTIQTLSAKLTTTNMERSSAYYNGGWIPIEKRLPTVKEVWKNDGRFILDDGNRRYQGIFDYVKQMFVWFSDVEQEDKCCIAWMPLPEPYRPEEEE